MHNVAFFVEAAEEGARMAEQVAAVGLPHLVNHFDVVAAHPVDFSRLDLERDWHRLHNCVSR